MKQTESAYQSSSLKGGGGGEAKMATLPTPPPCRRSPGNTAYYTNQQNLLPLANTQKVVCK